MGVPRGARPQDQRRGCAREPHRDGTMDLILAAFRAAGPLASRRMADGQPARGRCVGPRLRPRLDDGGHEARGRQGAPLCFQGDCVGGVARDAQAAPREDPTRRFPHRPDGAAPLVPVQNAATVCIRAPAAPANVARRLEGRAGACSACCRVRATTPDRGSRARSTFGDSASARERIVAGMRREVLGWDCWGGDAGIRHANVVLLGVTADHAMTSLLARAVQKYGPQDWSTWEFRAEPVPKASGAAVVHFVWESGVLRLRNPILTRRPCVGDEAPGA